MATDRRVIFGTYVVPTRIDTMEEESISKTSFLGATGTDTLSKTLGGKGSVIIHATQWGDGWVSFAHQGAYWEDQSDVWELVGETWSGELSITSAVKLTDDTSTTCAFVYIKNTGTSVNAEVSLNGTSGNYWIIIPPGGSVHLRGGSTSFNCNSVFVRGASGSSTTTIEFIIAQITP